MINLFSAALWCVTNSTTRSKLEQSLCLCLSLSLITLDQSWKFVTTRRLDSPLRWSYNCNHCPGPHPARPLRVCPLRSRFASARSMEQIGEIKNSDDALFIRCLSNNTNTQVSKLNYLPWKESSLGCCCCCCCLSRLRNRSGLFAELLKADRKIKAAQPVVCANRLAEEKQLKAAKLRFGILLALKRTHIFCSFSIARAKRPMQISSAGS